MFVFLTFRTDAFNHEIDSDSKESLWHRYMGDGDAMQAKGSLAAFTIEVPMLVIMYVVVAAGTHLIT